MISLLKKIFFLCIGVLFYSQAIFAQDSIHIDLQKAIEIALSENPTITIANRTIEAKKYYKSEQIAALFPDISLSASYQRTVKKQKMSMAMNGMATEIEVGTSNNYSAGLSFSLPLIAAPTWYNLKLANIDIQAAIEDARSSKISLINQIKSTYYGLLFAQDSYRALQVSYTNVQNTAQNITDKYNHGLASEFEKLRADVQVQNQIPQLTSTENTINVTILLLKVLIGLDINEPVIFDGQLSDFENEMSQFQQIDPHSISLSNNSDLRKLSISQNQLNTSINLIKSSSCPMLVLSGNYQYMTMANDFKFSNYNWFPYSVIGLSLQVPIVAWAGTIYKIKQAKINVTNLEEQKKYVENNLRVSIHNDLNSMSKAIANMTSTKETLEQAQKAYDIVKKQFEIGMATWLDLDAAEVSLTQSKLLYNQSIYDFLIAKANLEAVIGTDR